MKTYALIVAVSDDMTPEAIVGALRYYDPSCDVDWIPADDHFINIDGTKWSVEHSGRCRLQGEMAACEFHVFGDVNVASGQRVYPTGRFRMEIEDDTMVLQPVV